MRCHNCGSDRTESDSASGTSYCVDCGTVLEENTIVAEVTFGETSGGKAVLQGSYAGESGRISGGGLFGRNRGREGQEQAIENGRIKISSLAHAVRLPERYREAAQRYYNLAVVNRFTRGRRSDHVAAVCLYAVCRTEKSSHMLIDFSDILQVNVFTLGATFLKLCRVLNLSLPHVDPSIYISRFAVALDFGDYTQRVAQDAVRLTQRMDRDWITSGRRPAGVCGACLLMAARMNGFRRTTKEMTYVVKVADVTIQKRLYEFNQTESAQLSVHDFRTLWLEKRADPPSFQKNRKIQEETESISSGIASPYVMESSDYDKENTETEEDDEVASIGQKREGKDHVLSVEPPQKIRASSTVGEEEDVSEADDDLVELFGSHQKNITAADNGAKGPKPVRRGSAKAKNDETLDETTMEEQLIEQQIQDTLNKEVKEIANVDASLSAQASILPHSEATQDMDATQVGTQVALADDTQATLIADDEAGYIPLKDQAYEKLTTEQKLELTAIAKAKVAQEEQELLNPHLEKDAQDIAEEMESWLHDESVLKAAKDIEKETHADGDDEKEDDDEEQDEGSLSDVDCDEIDAMILTPEEVTLKTKVWYNANKEYLQEMAVRRMVEKDKGVPYGRKNKYKKKKLPQANSPAEAAKQLLEKKKLSKKINQAVFDDMFESPESIAKIKARDTLKKMAGVNVVADVGEYEVVEEPGDVNNTTVGKKSGTLASTTTDGASTVPTAPTAAAATAEDDDDDDEDMDSDDMADDERFMRDARANYTLDAEVIDYDDYGDDNDDDF
ncbi:hypothetical protein HMPREF1544_02240 [Mucor circinelloides 1006PhL]|uniref:B-related factor 1 n=1 Tax=Mucor circinelloides f. circinelloides (strain 1006PhL) TaxID=1220926 RepID=S2JKY0_MUCC1|nr:hypothetical protein HMPREF1544_02240 [Mucor circinelloides 1006PhL]